MATISEVLALAVKHHQAGDLPRAKDLYYQVLQANPEHAESWHLIGILAHQVGHHQLGAEFINKAISLDGANAAYHSNLGAVYAAAGQMEDAVASYRKALALRPDLPDAHNNLANTLKDLGQLDEAEQHLRQALRLKPDYAEAHNNLATVLRIQGRTEEAVASYGQALRHKPDYASAHTNLGATLLEEGQLAEALACHEEALRYRPDFAEAYQNLGHALMNQGKLDEAGAAYQRAVQLQPGKWFPSTAALLLPPIYESVADLRERRQRFLDALERLREAGTILDPNQGLPPGAFYLAYQGFNDREVMRDLGRLFRVPAEEGVIPQRPHASGKIRIGFLSSFFRYHAVGKILHGFIAHLSRQDFEIVVLSIGKHHDELARFFQQQADQFILVPSSLDDARRLLAQLALDILVFPDIGMHPLTYALALSRLAPVQCVFGGHPVTTGLDTVDYFVSSELTEPPHAEEHYTETLVRLKTIAVYYYRPAPPDVLKGRVAFGLPAERHLYGCFQTLYKFHPEFDPLLVEILRRDPQGELLLVHGLFPAWDEQFQQRLARAGPDVANRIRFLPRQDRPRFLNLVSLCDVLLDPLHFSGGTTSYESLAIGTPIVTLPAAYLRGRSTVAMYKKMEIHDCVAADEAHYVELAVRVGTEPDYREELRRKIMDANSVLYEDVESVHQMEDFFRQAVREVRNI